MIDIQLDTRGFFTWLRSAHDQFQANAKQALGQSVALALRNARATQAFKDQSGALRRSIVRGERGTWVQFVAATAKHAAYVEHGTRPHRIEARRAKTLRFVQAGAVRFRRGVNHPGTKPTNFLERATHETAQAFANAVERAAVNAFR